MINRQSQKGGDGSTNIQTDNMIFQVGIDEKRAREIYQEMNLQLKKDYTADALVIANNRVAEFEDKLMPKMLNVDGALEAFADPSFQLLLHEAQKTAAASERPADYDILSELLIHRFEKGTNRVVRAGINIAVKVVDEISDDALLGLTTVHAVNTFLPATGFINDGLDVLNKLYEKIMYGELPTESDWLDHLDILNAVRVDSFNRLKKVKEYYSEQLPGYTAVGIKKQSADYFNAVRLILEAGLPNILLIEHELNSDYVRLPIVDREKIATLRFKDTADNGDIHAPNLTQKQLETLYRVYDMYNKDPDLIKANINAFMQKWDERPNLKVLRIWWDNLDGGIKITSVGRVLAHSNAQRCDSTLQPLA